MTELVALADADLAATFADLAGQLAPRSKKLYANDAAHFAGWLRAHDLTLLTFSRSDAIIYRNYLGERYAKVTAGRMLTVARRLCGEAVKRGVLPANPVSDIRGFRGGDNETPHTALTHAQAREMLAAIDRSTNLGRRDYAIVMLLLRTGIRRAEAAALSIGDISQKQGHAILTVQHGKGDKRRIAKLPVDILRAVNAYLQAGGRQDAPPDAPLFVRCTKNDRLLAAALSDKGIERVVVGHARAVGISDLTPHGLRASFITLTLEGGAKLQQVQYAAGHADPRTTERYQKRKLNLDDNAVDYLRL